MYQKSSDVDIRCITRWAFLLLATVSQPLFAEFNVYDATLFKGKPDMGHYSIKPINVIYTSKLWPNWKKNKDKSSLPPKDRLQELARKAAKLGYPVVLDIEHWPVKGEEKIVKESIRKYRTVLGWFRESAPEISIGLYGVIPVRDYWRAIRGKKNQEYKEWSTENDRLSILANYVDVIYPSVYTFYSNEVRWKIYAKAQIEEARKYGKPVVAFLLPKYHNSNKIYGKQYMRPTFWRMQLETMKEYADGIVIWGGWKAGKPEIWDDKADWWRETVEAIGDGTSP